MRTAHADGIRKALAQRFVRYTLRRHFAAIHIRGDPLSLSHNQHPTLYVANHSSVWDYHVASYVTTSQFNQDPFVMTAAFSMLPFAEWAGAFSVDSSRPFGVVESIRYAVDLLDTDQSRALWIFAQGEIARHGKRPLGFKSGAAAIALRCSHIKVVPVAIYYSYANHTRTEAFVQFGKDIKFQSQPSVREMTDELERHVTGELDELISDLDNSRTDTLRTILVSPLDLRSRILRLMGRKHPPLKSWGVWYRTSDGNFAS